MKKNLEIYIHIPFCLKKCHYCDFFSVTMNDEGKSDYIEALVTEIRATEVSNSHEVVSVFFGGGTPSILSVASIRRIMDVLKEQFEIADNAEITIECNPGTVDAEKLLGYKHCGINRLSFGLQSTDNDELLELGRIHTYEEFLQSYNAARVAGFDNIGVDLMSGIPKQTLKSWRKTLKTIGRLSPQHISAYSLIVEADTPFATRKLILPNEDEEREMYEQTHKILADFGYHQYEISNYAKEGFLCRHNIGYWQRRDYLGFGAGAASLFNNVRYSNIKDLKAYQKNSSEQSKLRRDIEFLDERAGMEEFIFLGLRMTNGINNTKFQDEFGVSLRTVYGAKIDYLSKQELLDFDEHDLKLTRKGISISNYVFAELLI